MCLPCLSSLLLTRSSPAAGASAKQFDRVPASPPPLAFAAVPPLLPGAMSDVESVVSEAELELRAHGQAQFANWLTRERLTSLPAGSRKTTAAIEQEVRAELAKELAKERAAVDKERKQKAEEEKAKQRAKPEKREANQQLQSRAEDTEVQGDGQVQVAVLQNRAKLVLRVPVHTTILEIKKLICDGRACNFKGTFELDRIALYKGISELLDDCKLATDHELRVYLKRVTRGEKRAAAAVETVAAEPGAEVEELSGEQLLQHVRDGGSLRNLQEQINAERFLDALYKRLKRGGDSSVEDKKNDMLKALQEWRAKSAPGFVQDKQARTIRNAKAFRAVGRGFAALWQKTKAVMEDQVGVTEECLERELLGSNERPSKRFQTLVAKPVPAPSSSTPRTTRSRSVHEKEFTSRAYRWH